MQMTTSKEFAQKLDSEDTLAKYRGQFFIPPGKTRAEQLYFTGNSLGLQPKSVVDYIQQELNTIGKNWVLKVIFTVKTLGLVIIIFLIKKQNS